MIIPLPKDMTRTCRSERTMGVFFCRDRNYDESLRLDYYGESGLCLAQVSIPQVADLFTSQKETLLSWLSNEEEQYLNKFRFAKRRYEWISGRIAAKYCLLQANDGKYSAPRPTSYSILPNDHGQPVLSPASPGYKCNISISHSHRYAVAMTSSQPCGIDIQRIDSQILRVRERIATPSEIDLAQNALPQSAEASLTLLWTVKEAIKKHRLPQQPGLFDAITIEKITTGNLTHSWNVECRLTTGGQLQIVRVIHMDQYMLGWSQG